MPKVSKEDFAGLVRQKFPGVYDDLDDDTLVRAYIQAKPVYRDRVAFSEPGKIEELQGEAEKSEKAADEMQQGFQDESKIFPNPLQDIAEGRGTEAGTERFKGAMKSVAQSALGASAFKAGPVGEHMLEGAPELKEKIEGIEETFTPTNDYQRQGKTATDIAQVVGVPQRAGVAKPVMDATKNVVQDTVQAAKSVLPTKGESGKLKNAFDAVTPRTKDLTPTEYEELLKRGKVSPRSTRETPKYILSKEEKATATKYKDILQDKDPVKNSRNVINQITKEDEEVGNFLRENNAIFNTGELKNSILERLDDIDDVTIPEERITKLKGQMVTNFLKKLQKNDMETLWIARKEFDRDIDSAFRGSPTLQKEIKKEFRNAIQDFIAERTPDDIYKGKMKDMRQLFDVLETLHQRAAKERGMNAIQEWVAENPTKTKTAAWLATLGGAGWAFNAVTN